MLSDIGQKIFDMKYAVEKGETWEQACLRVAEHVASVESPEMTEQVLAAFYKAIYNMYFIPGGRVLANSGTGITNLNNCYYLPVEDSRTGIYDTLKDAAEIFAHGGGVGYNFSDVREEGAPIKTTGGKASGPLSFMSLFDQTGEVIQQASRRGAQMGILDVDHMDIEKFIDFKATPNSRNDRLLEEYDRNLRARGGQLKSTKYYDVLRKTLLDDQLTHFNISVSLTNDFMEKAANEEDFDLVSRVDPSVRRPVKAADLLGRMAKQAWTSGDPGVLFEDRVNEDNMVPYIGRIRGTNPCVTGDTEILTVYEGKKTFKELAERGEDILVFSWHPETKRPVARMMHNPRKTGEKVPVIEVEFDSGLKLKCTPDHGIYTYMGERVRADELKPGQSVRAYTVAMHREDHFRVYCWEGGKSCHQYVARMVWECFNGPIEKGLILHHKDFNKLNNKVENLEVLTNASHNRVHYAHRSDGGYFRRGGGRNHKVVAIRDAGFEDVYNGTVDDSHTYIIADPVPTHGAFTGIVSANCGEVPLLPYEPCCLGSINLAKFYSEETNSVDLASLEQVVRVSTRFLDNVQEISSTPLEKVNYYSKGLRRLGLGVMGWADLLALLEIPYDSKDAYQLGSYLSWFISFFSFLESLNLAEERGAFPLFDSEKVDRKVLKRIFESSYVGDNKFDIQNMTPRNVSVTSIAPTGSIALIANVNSSIEPFFALAYKRNITEGVGNIAKDFVIEVNPILFGKLQKYGLTESQIEKVKEYVLKKGTLTGCDLVPDNIKAVFKTSQEIDWRDHVKAQAAWQEYVTNAVSKTINMPETVTVDDILEAYKFMWQSGLKGGTIYRNNSKMFQVLNAGS